VYCSAPAAAAAAVDLVASLLAADRAAGLSLVGPGVAVGTPVAAVSAAVVSFVLDAPDCAAVSAVEETYSETAAAAVHFVTVVANAAELVVVVVAVVASVLADSAAAAAVDDDDL
jgi:hypothetical protein